MGSDRAWLTEFPGLENARDGAWIETVQNATGLRIPAGRVVFRPGDPCQNFVFVRSGTIRVHKAAEGGREVVLYRVGRGDICVLTLFNLLGNAHYAAEGVAESEVEGAMISAAQFHRCLADCESFRYFIFSTIGQRLSSLMMLLEEVMFQRLDVRLARTLVERHQQAPGQPVRLRHSELAVELGSSREVISRILKEFEHRTWLSLARGQIHVLRPDRLTEFALAKGGAVV